MNSEIKKESINLGLMEVEELSSTYSDIEKALQTKVVQENFQYGLQFRITHHSQSNEIKVFVVVVVNCKIDESEIKLIKQEVAFTFEVKPMEHAIKFKGTKASVNKDLLDTLVGVCVGTIRGIILARSAGFFIRKFHLPLVNPHDINKGLIIEAEIK